MATPSVGEWALPAGLLLIPDRQTLAGKEQKSETL